MSLQRTTELKSETRFGNTKSIVPYSTRTGWSNRVQEHRQAGMHCLDFKKNQGLEVMTKTATFSHTVWRQCFLEVN